MPFNKMTSYLILSTLLLMALACGVESTPSGFESPSGRYGIFVMALDGSDVRQLYASDHRIIRPRLSPDGNTFVFSQFVRDLNTDGRFDQADLPALEIGLMSVEGGDYRLLTDNDSVDSAPVWSSDGSRILFASNRDGGDKLDLFVMDLKGNILRQLTATPDIHESDPDWVGDTIVYTSNRAGENVQSLWVMNADGTDAHQITFPPAGKTGDIYKPGDFDPALSPDGRWVAWERHLNDEFTIQGHVVGRWDIFVIGVDGTGERDLTNAVEAAAFPRWSPGGDRILFYAYTDGEHPAVGLHVMNSDGGDRRPITVPAPGLMVLGGDWFPTAEGLKVLFTAEVLR